MPTAAGELSNGQAFQAAVQEILGFCSSRRNAIQRVDGPVPIEIVARVAAQIDEPDRAIAALQKLPSIAYEAPLASNVPLTPALLRLDPMLDRIRNDPRFQKLAVSPPGESRGQMTAPKTGNPDCQAVVFSGGAMARHPLPAMWKGNTGSSGARRH